MTYTYHVDAPGAWPITVGRDADNGPRQWTVLATFNAPEHDADQEIVLEAANRLRDALNTAEAQREGRKASA